MKEETPIIFCFSDVKEFFLKHKRFFFYAFGVFALLGGLFSLQREVQYRARAVFKEGNRDFLEKEESEKYGKKFWGMMGFSSQNSTAVAMMQSRVFFKPIIQQLGLQGQVQEPMPWKKVCQRILEHFCAEMRLFLPEEKRFVFREVFYEGEKEKNFFFRFLERDRVEVLNRKKETILIARVHQKVNLGKIHFILDQVPDSLKLRVLYPVSFKSWVVVADKMLENLKIVPQKEDPKFLTLTFLDRNRHLAAVVLNLLMEQYENFLKNEHQTIAKEQLSYLEDKQKQLGENFEKTLSTQVRYFQEHVQEEGCFGVEQEMESIFRLHQETLRKIFTIDLESKRLKKMQRSGSIFVLSEGERKEREELKHRRDTLEVALISRGKEFVRENNEGLEKKVLFEEVLREKPKVEKILWNRKQAENLFSSLEREKSPLIVKLSYDPEGVSEDWTRKILGKAPIGLFPIQQAIDSDGELLKQLHHYAHLLSIREKLFYENLSSVKDIPSEFDGLDLDTADACHRDCIAKLEEVRTASRLLLYLQEQLRNGICEKGALSVSVRDPLLDEMIHRFSELAFYAQDEKNHSTKERLRLREELEEQKKFLQGHLKEMVQMKRLEGNLLEEKLFSLSKATVGLIDQRLLFLEEKEKECLQEKLKELEAEKNVLQEKAYSLKDRMKEFPERWKREELTKLKKEMQVEVMKTMTQMVESRTIDEHLFQSRSLPWEKALSPVHPDTPHFFLFSFLFFLFGGFFVFLISFCVALGKGLPISKETLLALGEEIGGFLSPFCEEKKVLELTESDVTTLRRAVSFIDNGTKGVKTIGVFIQEGFDCSRVLAELLERRGKKVLVVTCHFEEKASSLNFIKYMKRIQEECLVESKDGIDFLSLGASSQFGLEILGSKRFLELLDLWKTRYDLILLVRKKQMPQEDFFHLCDRGLFFLQGETREQMEKVFQWRKGMFIFARE